MEWFHGPKGLKFSEIGARPPGVGCWDLYSASNDVDVYREWAHVITHGMPEQPMRRPYSAGIVALRPDHDGQIRGYSGIDDIQARYGQWVIDGHFPPEGHHTSRWRPATWPTPTCACATPTTTPCAGCSTTWGAPSTCTPAEPWRPLSCWGHSAS